MSKYTAWNNFVMDTNPTIYDEGDLKRSAAISNLYMALANNGGINHFLSSTHEIDASEVLKSLQLIGAKVAAEEFGHVLKMLGNSLPATSWQNRQNTLDKHWTEALNDLDFLSREADQNLVESLEKHVSDNESFYLELGQN